MCSFKWNWQKATFRCNHWYKCPCILRPTPLPDYFNGCSVGDKTGEEVWDEIRVHVCACMHLRPISGKGLVIFGHGRRAAVTACGLRTEDPVFFLERGGRRGERREGWEWGLGHSLLWMSFYPAASLWLTVGLNWMSEAVSIKCTSCRFSGLKSSLFARWSVFQHWSMKEEFTFGLYSSVFLLKDIWSLKDCL